MLTPRPSPWLVLAAALLTAGCSARVARPTAPAAAGCREASYRGRYEPGSDVAAGAARGPRSFRASVRRCADGALLIELRGAVGGAQLLAAVRAGRVRLVVARERTVVDGDDSPALWERWTGLPISGALLAAALDATQLGSTEREAAGWRVRVLAGAAGTFPARADADGPGGARIELQRQSERPARDGTTWPEVPAGFRLLVDPEGAP